jgi:hypothetical protein
MSLDGKYNTFYIITILMLENCVRINFFFWISSLSVKKKEESINSSKYFFILYLNVFC